MDASAKKSPRKRTPKKQDAKNAILNCSFCGKNQHEVNKLIAGPKVFICDQCVSLCVDIIAEENQKVAPPSPTERMHQLAQQTFDLAGAMLRLHQDMKQPPSAPPDKPKS